MAIILVTSSVCLTLLLDMMGYTRFAAGGDVGLGGVLERPVRELDGSKQTSTYPRIHGIHQRHRLEIECHLVSQAPVRPEWALRQCTGARHHGCVHLPSFISAR